jgi:hypothetical protein
VTFPAGLTTIEVTGLNLLGLDGTPFSGIVIFSASGLIAVPAASTLLEGPATAMVVNGVMVPVVIPTTDCVSPAFTYTITQRLTTPDGVTGSPPPAQGVAIPSSLGTTVDLSDLVPTGPLPPASAFGTANTWSQTQTLAGSPALRMPGGAVAGYVWTTDSAGNGSWQLAGRVVTFTQPFSTASTVAVDHGLSKYPSVTVMDTADDEVDGDVQYTDLNHLTVSFTAPFSGTVICN